MTLLNYCLKLTDSITEKVDKYVLLEKCEEALTPIVIDDYSKLLAHAMCFDTEFVCSTVGYDENNKKMLILYGSKK